jgi:tetratricopeptide (TPR) repeat protein
LLLLTGCATSAIPRPALPEGAPDELVATPFFAQQAYHCGPAAMAMVLGASGIDVDPALLAPLLYVPDRRGSLQIEMQAMPRRHDRLAVEVDGTLDAIIAQLGAGRPVLVLQNLALTRLPRWHYAVVIGYLPDQDRFVLRSGTRERLLVARTRFLATWIRADRWGLVVLDPEETPAGLAAPAYLKAAAALEAAGRHQPALAAFTSARAYWPDAVIARLGVANNLYRLGRLEEAETAYRALLQRQPSQAVALHNLAMLMVETQRPCEALALLAPAADSSLIEAARHIAATAAGGVCRPARRLPE